MSVEGNVWSLGNASWRELVDTPTVTWDFSTNGQAKANGPAAFSPVAGGGIEITGSTFSTTLKRRTISDITAGDTIITTDRAKRVRILAGTGTLAFSALATLGDGFWCVIHNAGTGVVTLDPNAAETIDGLTSWALYPGGVILLQVTASDITSVLLAPMRMVFDASGTFVNPGAGVFLRSQVWSAGGSGGRGGAGDGGGGGGGGAYAEVTIALASVSASVSVTIGAGGVAQSADSTDGNAGGSSSFGAYLATFGGGGGDGTATTGNGGGGGGGVTGVGAVGAEAIGGTGGTPRNLILIDNDAFGVGSINELRGTGGIANGQGYANVSGGGGGGGGDNAVAIAGAGGESLYGGGGGGGGANGANTGGAGGFSHFGGAGGGGASDTGTNGAGGVSLTGGNGGAANSAAGVATSGTAPGGGGGGSESANSGAGAAGRIIITVW